MHKIIVGTPRSGTSFVTKWYANEYPQCIALKEDKLFEYCEPLWFKPEHPAWPDLRDIDIDGETRKRIRELPPNYIFKMHTGPDMSEYIWKFVYKRLVILVKRKDLLGQFISYGIGMATLKWVWYPELEHPDTLIEYVLLKTKCANGLEKGQTFNYRKGWFDDLVWRVEDLEKRARRLKIERTVWFEDFPNFSNNGEIMTRQNPQSNDEKLNLIENKNEFLGWFRDWIGEWK